MADQKTPNVIVTESQKLRIKSSLFDRLCNCQILFQFTQNVAVNDHTELNEGQATMYLNGCILAAYLSVLHKLVETAGKAASFRINIQKLQQLKFSEKIGAKPDSETLWLILTSELAAIGFKLDQKQITKIAAGDKELVDWIIQYIEENVVKLCGEDILKIIPLEKGAENHYQVPDYHQIELQQDAWELSQKIVVKPNVNIEAMQVSTAPKQTTNSLEFILTTLARAMNVRPIIAAGFLTNKNEFLIKGCQKGNKDGGFEPFRSWYKELIVHSQSFARLLIAEINEFNDPKHLADSLQTFSSGIFSTQVEIVTLCFEAIIKLFDNFDQQDEKIQSYAWAWFVSEEKGMLSQVIDLISEYPEFCQQLVQIISSLEYSRKRFKEVFTYSIRKICSSRHDFVCLMIDLLPHIKTQKPALADESGLILDLLDTSAREAENDGTHTANQRAVALTLMTDLWLSFTNLIDQNSLNGIIFIPNKKAVQEDQRTLKLSAAINLFRLFEDFSRSKNESAPIIYRALVYSVIANPQDEVVRQIFWRNFQQIFADQPEIPINLLLDPLLRQLIDSVLRAQNGGYQLREFDFIFLQSLSQHPKLQVENIIGFMDFLSGVIFKEVGFSKIAIDMYLSLIGRFKEENIVENKLLEFTQLCQARMVQIEKSETPPGPPMQKRNQGMIKKWISNLPQDIQFQNGFNKQLIYLILSRTLHQSNERVYNQLHQQIIVTQKSLQKTLKTKNKVIEAIINLNLGRGDQASKLDNSFADTALVPYGGGSTASMFKYRATMVISKIQKTLTEKEEMQRILMEQTQKQYEKRKINLKKQVDKRRYELGVLPIRYDLGVLAISEEGDVPVIKDAALIQTQQIVNNIIEWFDFELDFEDEEKFSLNLYAKRASKLWQNLFKKYANTGVYRINEAKLGTQRQFENTKAKNETIFLPELIKMFKDHDMTPKFMKKNEIQDLVRIINLKLGSNILTQLDYPGFLIFIEQAATNIFAHNQGTKHYPPAQMLRSLVNYFYAATNNKGQSTVFFDGLVQKEEEDEDELLYELTQRVEENKDFPLPAGYALVTEKIETLQYYMPAQILPFVPRSTTAVAYILDDLLFSIFNFHFLEPYVIYEEVSKIKKVFLKPKKELRSVDAVHLVTPARQFGTGGKNRFFISPVSKVVLLPPRLKLLVYDAVPEKRELLEEVAQTVELLIQAVERGSNNIYDQKPKQIMNQALQEQLDREATQRRIEEKRDRKRKERREQLRVQLEEQKKALEAENKKNELEKKEQILKSRARSPGDNINLPDINAKKITQFNFDSQLYSARVQSSVPPSKKFEFQQVTQSSQAVPGELRKLKLNVVHQVQKLQEQKQALVAKEKETQLKELASKEAIRRKAEKVLVTTRDSRNIENQFQKDLIAFMQNYEVSNILKQYMNCLQGYFSFYCKQQKAELGFDINFRLENIPLKEFIKFGHQSKIVPVLISSEELVQIFRNVARHQYTNDDSAVVNAGSTVSDKNVIQYISFQSFQQALIRICVYGHEYLGGLTKRQFEHKLDAAYNQQQTELKIKEYVRKKETERKNITQQVLAEMKDEFQEKEKKTQEILNRKAHNNEHRTLTGALEKAARDEFNFQRYLKQQENIGNGLQSRIELRLGQIVDDTLDKPTQGGTTTAALKNQYEKLQKDGLLNDKLSKVDIRDNAFRTRLQMDINLVSSETVTTLLKYIGMEPGDLNMFDIDRKLNAQRKEITGVQPTLQLKKIKLAELPNEGKGQFQDLKAKAPLQVVQKKKASLSQEKVDKNKKPPPGKNVPASGKQSTQEPIKDSKVKSRQSSVGSGKGKGKDRGQSIKSAGEKPEGSIKSDKDDEDDEDNNTAKLLAQVRQSVMSIFSRKSQKVEDQSPKSQ